LVGKKGEGRQVKTNKLLQGEGGKVEKGGRLKGEGSGNYSQVYREVQDSCLKTGPNGVRYRGWVGFFLEKKKMITTKPQKRIRKEV